MATCSAGGFTGSYLIRPRAEADLRAARDWYEKQRSGLGDQFIAEIAQTMERLEDNLEPYPEYHRGFRRVFRVLHAHRDHPPLLSSER